MATNFNFQHVDLDISSLTLPQLDASPAVKTAQLLGWQPHHVAVSHHIIGHILVHHVHVSMRHWNDFDSESDPVWGADSKMRPGDG
jgi:hypothetical protein